MPDNNPRSDPDAQHRLRLKLPTGAELEVEGSPAFIAEERREFIRMQEHGRPAGSAAQRTPTDLREPAWETILKIKGSNIQLRAKLRGGKAEKEACLILLAAAKVLLRNPKPTAAQLARWLRASGYPISRVDRAIQEPLDQGEVLASGSRRARRYELSGPGAAKAFGLAFELSRFIQPTLPLTA